MTEVIYTIIVKSDKKTKKNTQTYLSGTFFLIFVTNLLLFN